MEIFAYIKDSKGIGKQTLVESVGQADVQHCRTCIHNGENALKIQTSLPLDQFKVQISSIRVQDFTLDQLLVVDEPRSA